MRIIKCLGRKPKTWSININEAYAKRLIALWCKVNPSQVESLAEMLPQESLESIVLVILDNWMLGR